jgi:hypothetical protein
MILLTACSFELVKFVSYLIMFFFYNKLMNNTFG